MRSSEQRGSRAAGSTKRHSVATPAKATAAREGSKKPKKEAALQRTEVGRRRADAALVIQRAWNRYYVSAARRQRYEAVVTIQRAWTDSVLRRNAQEELRFLRWLKNRRAHLRGRWLHLTDRLRHLNGWALCVIIRAIKVYVWRRRLYVRRRTRHAIRIQRWYRRQTHLYRTRGYMLWCMEAMEYMKSERCIRGTIARVQRQAFMELQSVAHRSTEDAKRGVWKRWVLEHRLHYYFSDASATSPSDRMISGDDAAISTCTDGEPLQSVPVASAASGAAGVVSVAPRPPDVESRLHEAGDRSRVKERPSSAFLRRGLRAVDDGVSTKRETAVHVGTASQSAAWVPPEQQPPLRPVHPSALASSTTGKFVVRVSPRPTPRWPKANERRR